MKDGPLAPFSHAPFLTPGGNLGATSTNTVGLTNASITAQTLTSTAPPANVTLPIAKLHTLSAALLPCILSATCNPLFTLTATTNTLDALLAIARHPTDGYGTVWVANEFATLSSFQPGYLATAITGSELNESYGLAIDANNNIWGTNDETGVNGNNGTVTEFSNNGTPLSGASGFTPAGLNYPVALATDTTGNIWVANYGNASMTVLTTSGTCPAPTCNIAPPPSTFPTPSPSTPPTPPGSPTNPATSEKPPPTVPKSPPSTAATVPTASPSTPPDSSGHPTATATAWLSSPATVPSSPADSPAAASISPTASSGSQTSQVTPSQSFPAQVAQHRERFCRQPMALARMSRWLSRTASPSTPAAMCGSATTERHLVRDSREHSRSLWDWPRP